ncbi:MFS transporter [Acidothermaceae bacterium B102]|nr:MFS transporter [Acidothermaceae bacterium B102]
MTAKASGTGATAERTMSRTGSFFRGGWAHVRRATYSSGAGESGLGHLVELHGVASAGDALFTVALAGSLFLTPDPHAAKSKVALYLIFTLIPFAVVAPVLGPILDHFAHGRRIALAVTLVARAWFAYVTSHSLGHGSLTLYPAALGVLIMSKGYGVSRSAAVPRLLPEGLTLVSANSRLTLAGLLTAAIAAPLGGGIAHGIGTAWALRLAVVVYLCGAVIAYRLPKAVDSAEGEMSLAKLTRPTTLAGWKALVPRVGKVLPTVLNALRAQAALRALAGFLTLYLAFLIRYHHGLGPLSDGFALSALVIAAGAGSILGTAIGGRLSTAAPETLLALCLVVSTLASAVTAALFGLYTALTIALVGSLTASLGKLALDAIIQRDVPEAVRTSTFARSETVNQLGWVAGGAVGIALPLGGTFGFTIAATWLALTFVWVLRSQRRRHATRAGRLARAMDVPDDQHPNHCLPGTALDTR